MHVTINGPSESVTFTDFENVQFQLYATDTIIFSKRQSFVVKGTIEESQSPMLMKLLMDPSGFDASTDGSTATFSSSQSLDIIIGITIVV